MANLLVFIAAFLTVATQVAAEDTGAQKSGHCHVTGYYYASGGARLLETPAATWEMCQDLCTDHASCFHFSYWPDGGCVLEGNNVTMKNADVACDTWLQRRAQANLPKIDCAGDTVVSGPKDCGKYFHEFYPHLTQEVPVAPQPGLHTVADNATIVKSAAPTLPNMSIPAAPALPAAPTLPPMPEVTMPTLPPVPTVAVHNATISTPVGDATIHVPPLPTAAPITISTPIGNASLPSPSLPSADVPVAISTPARNITIPAVPTGAPATISTPIGNATIPVPPLPGTGAPASISTPIGNATIPVPALPSIPTLAPPPIAAGSVAATEANETNGTNGTGVVAGGVAAKGAGVTSSSGGGIPTWGWVVGGVVLVGALAGGALYATGALGGGAAKKTKKTRAIKQAKQEKRVASADYDLEARQGLLEEQPASVAPVEVAPLPAQPAPVMNVAQQYTVTQQYATATGATVPQQYMAATSAIPQFTAPPAEPTAMSAGYNQVYYQQPMAMQQGVQYVVPGQQSYYQAQ